MRPSRRLVLLCLGSSLAVLACSREDDGSGGTGSGVGSGSGGGAAGSGSLGVGGRSGQGGTSGQAGAGGAPGPSLAFAAMETTAFLGSNTGTEGPGATCKPGSVLTGASFKQNPGAPYSGSLYALTPRCAALSIENGALVIADAQLDDETIGNSGVDGKLVEATCPGGSAVVAMEVWRKNVTPGLPGENLAYDMVLTCRPISIVGDVFTYGAPVGATKTSDDGVATAGTVECTLGKVAIGFDGLYGSEVDQFGLVCASVGVVP